MTNSNRLAEVEAADAFLAEAKTLDGPPPDWRDSAWGGEQQAIWNVVDSLGSTSGQLRFVARKADSMVATVNLIYRQRPLWRIDLDPSTVCHANPPSAHAMGLDATVCGPHSHTWWLNRSHVISQDTWGLPYRVPLPPTVRRLGQALLWLAGHINLTLEPDQRGFDGPTRRDLFEGGGR